MATPPKSLSELHYLLTETKNGHLTDKGSVRLGKRAILTLEKLLQTPRQAAIHPIDKLARSCGVSPSTLSRLANRLGYHGFKQFQGVFRSHITNENSFYSDLAGKLTLDTQISQKNASISEKIAKKSRENIIEMHQNLKIETLSQPIDLLINTPNIHVLGYRQSASLASHFSYCLGMLRRNVRLLSAPEHGAAHGLAQLVAGDTLVVFSCYPYTRTSVSAAYIAAAKGAKIIAITDDVSSPLATKADHVLVAPTDSIFYSNSMAAMLVLNEILLSLIAHKLGANGIQSLKEREHIIHALEAEFGEN